MSLPVTPWTNTRIERVNSAVLAARGGEVLKKLAERGVRISPGNRIERAINFVQRANSDRSLIREDDPDTANRFLEALRTLLDSFMVVWAMVERPRRVDPFPPSRLEYLLLGADTPAEDANPKPRSVQFELVVGAHFVMGGADIEPTEPDYTLLYWGKRIGVAVKRLSSLKPRTLEGRLREAADQIDGSTGSGIVALNLDSWVTDLSARDADEVGRKFNEQLLQAHRQLVRISRKRCLLGALILANWTRWRFEGPKPSIDWRNPTQFFGFADGPDDPEVQKSREFMEAVRARFENSLADFAELLA